MQKKSLKQKAYEMIKDKIINCEYLPNAIINEAILVEEIKVSRTPVREAINRLEQEHLVKILPKKGIIISELSLSDVQMIYQTRQLIEPHVVKMYGAKVDREELLLLRKEAQLQMTIKKPDKEALAAAFKADNDFHMLFINKSNNRYYKQIMEQIYAQNQRIRVLTGVRDEARFQNTAKGHQEIINYLLDEKYTEAAGAMNSHLEEAKMAIFKNFMDI